MSHVLAVLGVSLTLGPRTVAVVPVWVKEVSVSVIEVAVGLVRVIAVAVVSVTVPVSVRDRRVSLGNGGAEERERGTGDGSVGTCQTPVVHTVDTIGAGGTICSGCCRHLMERRVHVRWRWCQSG